jgi:ketosteroid isomerase-like protein
MAMLQGVDATIGNPVSETGRVLNQQVDPAMPFAGNPMLGIAEIREMFDQTFRAMDAMDNFRAKAIDIAVSHGHIVVRTRLDGRRSAAGKALAPCPCASCACRSRWALLHRPTR